MTIHSPQPRPQDAAKRDLVTKFQIERYGRTWSGSWTVDDDSLVVTSTYGSRSIPVGATQDLDVAAQAILGKIVVAWRRALPANIDRRK
jgi:hypothetical protein